MLLQLAMAHMKSTRAFWGFRQAQVLTQEKSLFVALTGEGVNLGVVSFLLCQQLGLALLKDSLDDKLVLELLVGATDAYGGVLEDELGVALGGEGSDEVQLALGQFDHGLLAVAAKEKFANYPGMLPISTTKQESKRNIAGK